jgi:hypothetical protein
MKSSGSQVQQLKLMISLEEQRERLQLSLQSLESKLAELKRRLVTGAAVSVKASVPSVSSKPASKAGRRSSRAGRGELKSAIFSALEKAGSAGVKVMDLAKSIGAKPANIYAWFHAAVKRYPGIKKAGNAHYKLIGKTSSESSEKAKPAVVKAVASKAAKAPKAKGGKRGRRGALQEKVLAALKAAGSSGIAIKDLSSKVGAPYRNLQVWFATTGKKNKAIKKVGPAVYKLVG